MRLLNKHGRTIILLLCTLVLKDSNYFLSFHIGLKNLRRWQYGCSSREIKNSKYVANFFSQNTLRGRWFQEGSPTDTSRG